MRCEADRCRAPAIFHVTWAAMRHCTREQHLCEEHALPALENLQFAPHIASENAVQTEGARCFDICLVIICESREQQVVYLQEVGGTRLIAILIGIFEATTIDRLREGFTTPRPLTHNAMFTAIAALGGSVEDVVITDFESHIYFTHLRIRQDAKLVLVDIRPSDAFAIALLANKPIFISDQTLTKVGLEQDIQS
jgi:uncharacterized protein